MARKLLLTLSWLIPFSIFSYTSAQGFNLIRYDSFEEYEVRTKTLDYWKIQNCGIEPSFGTTYPLIVTNEQSRAFTYSVYREPTTIQFRRYGFIQPLLVGGILPIYCNLEIRWVLDVLWMKCLLDGVNSLFIY